MNDLQILETTSPTTHKCTLIHFLHLCLPGEGLEPAFSFLATLASSTSEEMESQLQERVESSRRAVAQIVTKYDKLQEKMDMLSHKLNSGGMTEPVDCESLCSQIPTFLTH